MWSWLGTSQCAVAGYATAGVLAVALGVVEHRANRRSESGYWPTFWFATGGLLLLMALGRASDVGELLTELGRDQARSGGWYETRRSLQTWVIGGVAASWTTIVAVAVWRVPERRRRYLPSAIAVFTLVGYAGIRLVSLHQIDAVLHRREAAGVTIGALVEVGLLVLILAVTASRLPRRRDNARVGPAAVLDAPADRMMR